MPSPFPGMDPWLEEPGLWPDVHLQLIAVVRELLNQSLGERYFARVEERVYIADDSGEPREFHVADVKVHELTNGSSNGAPSVDAGGAAVAPIIATTLLDAEIHEPYVAVIDRKDRSVIAVVEVLSPSNKRPGSTGLRVYREKRHEVMTSDSHLVEIDLLRFGARIPVREKLPPFDYLVHVSHRDERPRGRLWPIRLDETLPAIRVPLRADDPECPLDLQRALDLAYDRADYRRELRYADEPTPALTPEQAAWAKARLLGKNLR